MTRFFNHPMLQTALLADGVFSLMAGAGLVVFAVPAAALAGPGIVPLMFHALGFGLLAWGAVHIVLGRQTRPAEGMVRAIILGDLLWIIASIGLLVAARNAFSITGLVFVAVAMVGVADFMIFKIKGLSHQRALA